MMTDRLSKPSVEPFSHSSRHIFSLKVLLLILVNVLFWQNANATLFFTDHFDYTDGANLGSTTGGGGAAWTLSSGDVSQIKVSAASTQSAPDGYAGATGFGVAVTPTSSRKQTGVPFNGTTGIPVADGNVVYASFLLNVQTLPASGKMRVAYMHNNASTQGGIEVVVSSTGQVGIQKKGSGTTYVSGTPVVTPGTHLVIMRYTFQSGNDEVAVWVDPDSSSYGAAVAPTSGEFAATTGGGSDMSNPILYFIIESAAMAGPAFWIDEVRVGTTWADVTPSGGPIPVPVITKAIFEPEGLILRGTNGPPNRVYQVLASTNLTLAVSNWPSITAHTFDSTGHFASTNSVAPGLPRQFFCLYVGGTLPPPPTAPSITNQPQNIAVAVGDDANFSVGATGTGPLSYFWSFDTNTPVGSNSDTLVLSDVQTNEAGSYRVVVSNSLGAVSSSVATLTVVTVPVVTKPPQDQSAVVSNEVAFTATAAGPGPLRYQWFFNTNTPVGGNTNALVLPNVQTNDAGTYSVRVSNDYGAVTSSLATLTVFSPPEGGGNLYVAPDGLDANPGTVAEPTTLARAITLVQPGGTIYVRGGTYSFSNQITIERTNSGFGEQLRKNIFAYPTEHPVLDFSSEPYGKTSSVSNPRGIQINGHWWHLRGLEVKGSADNGIFVAGNSNIVELCVTDHNRDTGLQISRYSSSAARSEWPSYNLILNCDSYDNYDCPPNSGENADGFACKLTSGPGNVFRGCVSHNNIDDGWDLFTKTATGPIDPVTIDQCVSYSNGTLTDGTTNENGDRNGFKLGGSGIAVNHIVTRCIAFDNGKNGFTWNSNPGQIYMLNNLAFDNVRGNFKFDQPGPIFRNNLSLWTSGSSGISTGPSNVFWYNHAPVNDAGLTVTTASFQSLTVPPGGFTRNADGSLNLGSFGKLIAGSSLIDAGVVPVLPAPNELPFDPATYYLGGPDIGAVESGP